MADQEVAKHTKKMWEIFTDGQPFWHKLREIALEIIIIVFAVSLSIWLHGLGEHRHEQKQVKTFLLGLKRDLQSDIAQIKDVMANHKQFDADYTYLAALDPAAAPEAVKFDAAYDHISYNSLFIPQLSRYEGFKSSGKLTNIEDDELLEKIVDLYQHNLPLITLAAGGWGSQRGRLVTYLETAMDGGDTREIRYRLVTAAKGKRLAERVVTSPQLYQRFENFIASSTDIIKQIDAAYPAQK